MGNAAQSNERVNEMELLEFVSENYLILVPVLWVIGTFLKKSPKVPDWTIPWIILVLGVVGSVATAIDNPLTEAVIQGILVAGAAVLTHELIKETIIREP